MRYIEIRLHLISCLSLIYFSYLCLSVFICGNPLYLWQLWQFIGAFTAKARCNSPPAFASGFQSSQFREFEFLLGYKRADMLRFQQAGTPAYERLVRRLHEPTVMDAFYDFLEQHGSAIPPALRQRCLATTETGGNPSYVEVLVCLQMGQDATQLDEPSPGRK